jgi:hypothetical protein
VRFGGEGHLGDEGILIVNKLTRGKTMAWVRNGHHVVYNRTSPQESWGQFPVPLNLLSHVHVGVSLLSVFCTLLCGYLFYYFL